MSCLSCSIQRLNQSGASCDSPLLRASSSEVGGTKTTLSYLWRRLAESGVDVGVLWASICSVVVKSLVCVESAIPNQLNRCATIETENVWVEVPFEDKMIRHLPGKYLHNPRFDVSTGIAVLSRTTYRR